MQTCIERTTTMQFSEELLMSMVTLPLAVIELQNVYQEESFFELVFKNNFADNAGSMLYEGKIGNWKTHWSELTYIPGEVFGMLFNNNDTAYITTSKISSNQLYMLNRPKDWQTDAEEVSCLG